MIRLSPHLTIVVVGLLVNLAIPLSYSTAQAGDAVAGNALSGQEAADWGRRFGQFMHSFQQQMQSAQKDAQQSVQQSGAIVPNVAPALPPQITAVPEVRTKPATPQKRSYPVDSGFDPWGARNWGAPYLGVDPGLSQLQDPYLWSADGYPRVYWPEHSNGLYDPGYPYNWLDHSGYYTGHDPFYDRGYAPWGNNSYDAYDGYSDTPWRANPWGW
ncbi:MAG: hypothetical protein HQL54_09240 [Magnetococcales bacterium]|nr:hypothetical protein [Magnetococcales bacterium]